jgi:hypothetical protein
MKKILFAFVVAFIFGLTTKAQASSLQVTYPIGGEQFETGQTINITWSQQGLHAVNVTLVDTQGFLFSAGMVTTDPAATQGSYSYTIPKIMPKMNGSYKVRLVSYPNSNTEPNGVADSPSYFTITTPPAPTPVTDFVAESVKPTQNMAYHTDDRRYLIADGAPLLDSRAMIYDFKYRNDGSSAGTSAILKVKFEINNTLYYSETNADLTGEGLGYYLSRVMLPAGSYHGKITLDPENVYAESNESNNSVDFSFTVEKAADQIAPLDECTGSSIAFLHCYDLTISDIILSNPQPKVDEPITIKVAAMNGLGGEYLTQIDTINFINTFPDFSETAVTRPAAGNVRPGDKFYFTFEGHFTAVGQKNLYFFIDPRNERRPELNEHNNEFTKTVTVVAAGSGQPIVPKPTPEPTPIPTPGPVTGRVEPVVPVLPVDKTLTNNVRGRIVLQVESRGEAWYVRPTDGKRMYLADGTAAYGLMRDQGLGITNSDLAKIPVGFESRFTCLDTDNDTLCDTLEDGLGTNKLLPDTDNDGYNDGEEVRTGHNPLGVGATPDDKQLGNSLKGKIVLQVQNHGEAWYINPVDGKRYYMPDGASAYQIMRYLSLGITTENLGKLAAF